MHVTKNGEQKQNLHDYPIISRQYKSFTTNGFYFWTTIATPFSTYMYMYMYMYTCTCIFNCWKTLQLLKSSGNTQSNYYIPPPKLRLIMLVKTFSGSMCIILLCLSQYNYWHSILNIRLYIIINHNYWGIEGKLFHWKNDNWSSCTSKRKCSDQYHTNTCVHVYFHVHLHVLAVIALLWSVGRMFDGDSCIVLVHVYNE